MLEIHPLTDEEALREYLSQNHLPEDAAVLRAYENGEVTGNISLTLETQPNAEGAMRAFLLINTFEYPDDFTCELMLRAAASFATATNVRLLQIDNNMNSLDKAVGMIPNLVDQVSSLLAGVKDRKKENEPEVGTEMAEKAEPLTLDEELSE